jgi:hypothetical protein
MTVLYRVSPMAEVVDVTVVTGTRRRTPGGPLVDPTEVPMGQGLS